MMFGNRPADDARQRCDRRTLVLKFEVRSSQYVGTSPAVPISTGGEISTTKELSTPDSQLIN
jgi:hypothetical protein